jgi:hypothetical protein
MVVNNSHTSPTMAGKVFRLREKLDMSTVGAKLKDFRRGESFDEEPLHTKLLTEIHDLTLRGDQLEGIYAEDRVLYISHHGERLPILSTLDAPFAFVRHEEIG